jgi:hypothetical protein
MKRVSYASCGGRIKSLVSVIASVALVASVAFPLGAFATSTGNDSNEEKGQITTLATSEVSSVSGIRVERDYVLTDDTVTFAGGGILSTTAPSVSPQVTGGEFRGAYIQLDGSADKRYVLTWLGTINGQICYSVEGESASSSQGAEINPQVVCVKQGNDVLIFSYKTTSDAHNVTYSFNKLAQTDLDDLGGTAKLIKGVNYIADGQTGYFQIERTPGTNLTVTATNADESSAKVEEVSTSNNSSYVKTYKLSGTKGNVTINVTPSWQKTSYNVQLDVKSTAGANDGRIRVQTRDIKGSQSNSDPYKQVFSSEGSSLSDSATITLTNNDSLSSSYVKWFYVTNSIGYKRDGNTNGWRQSLSAILVNGESVALPVAFKGGDSATTILQTGEQRGTKVTIWNYDTEASGDGNSTQIQRYGVTVSNVHTDIDVKMVYSPVGTQGVIWMDRATGVDAQLYFYPDYGTQQYTQWTDLTAGTYYYQKYSRDEDGNWITYQVKATLKPGYYNPKLTVTSKDGTSSSISLTSGEAASIGKSISNGDYAVLTFSAEPIKYSIAYDANGGAYATSPADGNTYDSAVMNQLLLSSVIPSKANSVFAGYKIEGNEVDHIFKPGDLIDLTDASTVNLSNLTVDSSGNATIKLVAQWKTLSESTDTTTVKVESNKLTSAGAGGAVWTTESKEYTVAKGATYVVVPETNVGDWKLTESENLEGIAGSSATPTLTYKHPASVTYSANTDVYEGALPTTQNEGVYAYETVDLADNELTRQETKTSQTIPESDTEQNLQPQDVAALEQNTITEQVTISYKHIGWMNQSGVTYSLGETGVMVPWGGLNLLAIWKVESKTATEDITANDFALTQNQLAAFKGLSQDASSGGLSESQQEALIKYADAKAFTVEGTTQTPENITNVTTTLYDADDTGGTFTVTFTTEKGTTETVTATVMPKQVRKLFINADDITLTLTGAHYYVLAKNDVLPQTALEGLKALANATAYYTETGSDVKTSVAITGVNDTIEAKPGTYTAAFTTAAVEGHDNADGIAPASTTVTVTVLPEYIEAQDVTLKVEEVEAGVSSAELIELAKAHAWNGDAIESPVEVSIDQSQSDHLSTESGKYKLTFTTENGTAKTISVTVLEPEKKEPVVDPEVDPVDDPDDGDDKKKDDEEPAVVPSNDDVDKDNSSKEAEPVREKDNSKDTTDDNLVKNDDAAKATDDGQAIAPTDLADNNGSNAKAQLVETGDDNALILMSCIAVAAAALVLAFVSRKYNHAPKHARR